jgi:starch synthase
VSSRRHHLDRAEGRSSLHPLVHRGSQPASAGLCGSSRNGLRVLFVTSEVFPLAKTGGLADVSAALPVALSRAGVDVRLLMPGYPSAFKAAAGVRVVAELPAELGVGKGRLVSVRTPDSGLSVFLVDCPDLYARSGGPYQDADGRDWADNADRFGLLARVGAALALGRLAPNWRADVVHANDWPTGPLPALLSMCERPRPATVFTIHNMAFQGLFPFEAASALGLAPHMLSVDGAEFYGRISCLKAGIRYADRVTTVSPRYAQEICTEEFGCGLHGLLQQRAADTVGILNGADPAIWNPASDVHLHTRYNGSDLSGKAVAKKRLQDELGLEPSSDVPLIASASRLTHQKMIEIVAAAVPHLIERGAQFVLIGDGERGFEDAIRARAREFPGRVAVRIGYEEPLAHRIFAGADLVLAPARFEPCGLTPIYAMRYGALPIVRRVGGLVDSVVDCGCDDAPSEGATGFAFDAPTLDAMLECCDRALAAYRRPALWLAMQRSAMSRDSSWQRAAEQYLALYRAAAGVQPPMTPNRPPTHRAVPVPRPKPRPESPRQAGGDAVPPAARAIAGAVAER